MNSSSKLIKEKIESKDIFKNLKSDFFYEKYLDIYFKRKYLKI